MIVYIYSSAEKCCDEFLLLLFNKMSHQNSSMTGASGGGPVSPQERSPATRVITNSEKKIGHRRVGEGGVTFKKVADSLFVFSLIFKMITIITQLYADSNI